MVYGILNCFLNLALRHRRLILVSTVTITLITFFLASQIGLDMKWTTVLPQSHPLVKQWIQVSDDFPLGSNYIITVKADSSQQIEKAVDLIMKRVEALDEVTTTYGKIPEDFLINHGLRTLKPKDLRRVGKIFSDVGLVPYLSHLNDDFEREFSGDSEKVKDQERELVASLAALEDFIRLLDQAASKKDIDPSNLIRTVRDLSSGNPYFLSLDKQMGIIPVAVKAKATDYESSLFVDAKIIKILDEIKGELPEVNISTTGAIPISRDEMESIGSSTMVLSLAALLIIFVVLVWNFRSVYTPLFAVFPIIVGIIWAVGFYRLTIVDLNIVTAMIMLVLLGLGIDFSIHLITRFYEERGAGKSLEEALSAGVVKTGKGVVTGAITSALAFFALMVGDTKGIVEFGFCAGSGIIIILAAIFFILPALLVWRDNRLSRKDRRIQSRDFDALGNFAGKVASRKSISLSIVALLAVVAVYQIRNIEYEYNLMETEPEGLDSIMLQDEIIDRFKLSIDMAFTTVDTVSQSRSLSKKLKKKSVVGEVDSIDRWLPELEWIEHNDSVIRRLKQDIDKDIQQDFISPAGLSARKQMVEELQRLLHNMIEIEELSFISGQDRVLIAFGRITGGEQQNGILVKLVNRFKVNQVDWQGIDRLAQVFSLHLKDRLTQMVKNTGPVTEEMLPEKLRNIYKNKDTGRYLVQVYPKKNLYEREPLLRFTESVNSASSNITGIPNLMLLINESMIKDGTRALLVAALVIFILIFIDLRNLTATLVAMIPLMFGVIWMLASMVIFGIKLNFSNMAVIPIIIGIGVDNGIHILHRWRQEGIGGLQKATAKVGHAILMTSITTMVGFGSISFYTHRGMASLGNILFLGVGFCFLSTILILPSLGSFVEKRIINRSPDDSVEYADGLVETKN